MKKTIIILLMLIAQKSFGQSIKSFDGRWCFTGSSTLQFYEKEEQLFCRLIDEHDTENFNLFYKGQRLTDTSGYLVNIDSSGSKLFLSATIKRNSKSGNFFFVYNKSNDSTLFFVGDVYYDTTKIKYSNLNCNENVPFCSNHFYTREKLSYITKLKDLNKLTREEAFEVFTKFKIISATRCNRCYEGFPGADFNNILISMGFNPITQEKFNDEMVYQTSAFDFIMDKFIGRESVKKDKELYEYYKAVSNEYFNGKKE